MLRMQTRVLPVLVVIAGTLLLAACPERTTIGRINGDPYRFAGKEVTIAGRVANSFGGLGTGVFELQDETGRMWVFSEKYGVPGRDARIAVTGRVEQGLTFGGRNFAVILRETQRRH